MHRSTIRDRALAVTVRAQTLGGTGAARLANALEARVAGPGDERGSQTVEYAMLGGVSAAACAALAAGVKDPSFIKRVLEVVLTLFSKTIKALA
jgi:hypothetical protein